MVARVNIRLGGRMGAPAVEEWSIGLNYGNGGVVLDQSQSQELAEDLADAIGAGTISLGTLANGVGANVTLENVDVYSYPDSGPAIAHGVDVVTPTKTFTGTTSMPPQTTGCITLQTPIPGRSYRGRVFWPQTSGTLAGDFRSANAKGLAGGLKTLNTGLVNALAFYGSFQLVVYSAKLDVVTAVTSLRSGDVLDTQRRRRDAIAETFTAVSVP